MVSNFARKHIDKKVEQANLKGIGLSEKYEATMNACYAKISEANAKLLILKGGRKKEHIPDAYLGFPKKFIVVNSEWISRVKISAKNEDEIHKAFMITIGHELSHKERRLSPWKRSIKYMFKYMKVIAYVNEIYADFGGVKKMMENNQKDRTELIKSCKYKQTIKKSYTIDCDTPHHPSWDKRIYYVSHFNFNEDLRKRIIEKEDCFNTEITNMILEFYKNCDITLNEDPLSEECDSTITKAGK